MIKFEKGLVTYVKLEKGSERIRFYYAGGIDPVVITENFNSWEDYAEEAEKLANDYISYGYEIVLNERA